MGEYAVWQDKPVLSQARMPHVLPGGGAAGALHALPRGSNIIKARTRTMVVQLVRCTACTEYYISTIIVGSTAGTVYSMY